MPGKREAAEAIRNEARMWMRILAEANVRPSAAVSILRERGLGYRTQRMLEDYRGAMEEVGMAELGRKVRVDAFPPPQVMREGWEHLRTNYTSRVLLVAREKETGRLIMKPMWYGHDRFLRVRDIIAGAQLRFAAMAEEYNQEDIRVEYGYTLYRPGAFPWE